MTCFFGGPRNSSFIRCSRIHTTAPTTRKNAAVTHHICIVNGRRKDQALEFSLLMGATIISPDSINGCVKSTIFVLFVTIAMSPITASKNYKEKHNSIIAVNISDTFICKELLLEGMLFLSKKKEEQKEENLKHFVLTSVVISSTSLS